MSEAAVGGEGAATAALGRRTLRVLGVVALCYVALIATHGGEFWPFSVYPMFASAGKPWQRALVRVVAAGEGTSPAGYALDELPGSALPLRQHGVPQNDLSSLVQRAERWSDDELRTLATMMGDLPCQAPLLVLRVRGSLEAGVPSERATPVARVACEGGQVRAARLLAAAP
jgi:hypothetical protein